MARAKHPARNADRHSFGPDLMCMNGECTQDYWTHQTKPTRCEYERPKRMGGKPIYYTDEAA
jgi:hypothetical protein